MIDRIQATGHGIYGAVKLKGTHILTKEQDTVSEAFLSHTLPANRKHVCGPVNSRQVNPPPA